MAETPHLTCTRCGESLTADAAGGLCPRCLMAMNFETRTMPEGEEATHVPPLSPEELAEKFPGFEILECLGRGGMGVVYKARQKSLNRTVAIKILAPEREHDARFAERFAREAELLAQLSHPHIVTIHDFGESGGLYYLVMEFVDGVNLRDLLRDGKLEPQQALAIVPPICDALQYAHDKGIVHRDIKPENLLLDRAGRLKIADFGIASLIESSSTGTPPVSFVSSSSPNSPTFAAGTSGYSAPEQESDSRKVDHRADIYALGVVLYEMLTGERPGNDALVVSSKLRGLQIDVRIDQMVLKALEKSPEKRFQTAGDFRTVVEMAAATPAQAAAPAAAPAFPPPPEGWIAGRVSRAAVLGFFLIPVFVAAAFICPGYFRNIAALGFDQFSAFLRDHPTPYNLIATLLLALLTIVGAAAPVLTTWLGWSAVSQIRRSAGRIQGLWLAVFDGLFFPLLTLNAALLTGVLFIKARLVWSALTSASGAAPMPQVATWEILLPTLLVLAVIDWFVVRRVWRAVKQPITGAPLAHSVAQTAPVVTEPVQTEKRGPFARLWWLFLVMLPVGALLGFGLGLGVTYLMPKQYEASGSMMIRPLQGSDPSPTMVGSVMETLRSREMLQEVASRLDLAQKWERSPEQVVAILKTIITVDPIRGTSLVELKVRHTNRKDATDIARTLAGLMRDSTQGPNDRSRAYTLAILEEANASRSSVSPNVPLILVLFTVAGLLLSPVAAVLLILLFGRSSRKPAQDAPQKPATTQPRSRAAKFAIGIAAAVGILLPVLFMGKVWAGIHAVIIICLLFGVSAWPLRGGKIATALGASMLLLFWGNFAVRYREETSPNRNKFSHHWLRTEKKLPNRLVFSLSHDGKQNPQVAEKIVIAIQPEGDTGWQPSNGQAMELADGRKLLFCVRVEHSEDGGLRGRVATKMERYDDWQNDGEFMNPGQPSTLDFADGLRVSMIADYAEPLRPTALRDHSLDAPDPAPGFGQEVERELTVGDLETAEGLNFASGDVVRILSQVRLEQMEEKQVAHWLTQQGIDLIVDNLGGWQWFGPGLQIAPVSQEQWKLATPAQLDTTLGGVIATEKRHGLPAFRFHPDKDSQSTFAFRTGRGATGFLKVTGITNNTTRVKIRYKLVQDPAKLSAVATANGDIPSPPAIVTPRPVALVQVSKDGRFRLDGQELSTEVMQGKLKALASASLNQPVKIEADADTKYQEVVRAIDLCQRAGLWNITFPVPPQLAATIDLPKSNRPDGTATPVEELEELLSATSRAELKAAFNSADQVILRMDARGQFQYRGTLIPYKELLALLAEARKPGGRLAVLRPPGVKRDAAIAKDRLDTLFQTAATAGWTEWRLSSDDE